MTISHGYIIISAIALNALKAPHVVPVGQKKEEIVQTPQPLELP